jgi:hypothetical protein
MQQVLEDTLSDLRMEIADTDLYDYRTMLKQRKAAIVKVLEAFKTSSPDE